MKIMTNNSTSVSVESRK